MRSTPISLPLLPSGAALKLSKVPGVLGGTVWPAAVALCHYLRHHRQALGFGGEYDNNEQQQQQQPLTVVELGSGTGAVGLYAAGLCSNSRVSVLLTDHRPPLEAVMTGVAYHPDGTPELLQGKSDRLLHLLEKNIQDNASVLSQYCLPKVMELDWTRPSHADKVRAEIQNNNTDGDNDNESLNLLVLASDVTYLTSMQDSLVATISRLLYQKEASLSSANTNDVAANAVPKCLVAHQERLLDWRGRDMQLQGFVEAANKVGLDVTTTTRNQQEGAGTAGAEEDSGKQYNVSILEVVHARHKK
jgi:predicted nicotinamide N-methyase